MNYRIFLMLLSCIGLLNCTAPKQESIDICIYTGNAAGVIAAVSAVRLGRSVVVIEPSNHLGGLTAGGLSSTDIGNKYAVTGLSRQFYRDMGANYGKFEQWNLEPSVAENILKRYIQENKVEVRFGQRLTSVEKSGKTLTGIKLEETTTGKDLGTVKAKVFLDCSYEGDLLAAAGVSFTVGREANSLYGETINGVQLRKKHQFPDGIDPYKVPGDENSGLLWGISDKPVQPDGTGDHRVQAYNFRLCLTQNKDNFIPVTRPENYDAAHYELLLRLMLHDQAQGKKRSLRSYFLINDMPNGKSDWNHKGGISIDFIGENHDYPEASYEERAKIWAAHEAYIKGMLYFVGHDPRIPQNIQEEMLSWGWAKDEFTDNGGFPHQMYVREARRMQGAYVMTEHHCVGDEVVPDPIALAAYTMDSHNCQRVVIEKDGKKMVKNEGNVEVGGFPPYPIAYKSLVPKVEECANLLVPVCLSASHVAYGSIRMEPVFMILGQVSAIAADLALSQNISVQAVNHKEIVARYEADPLLDGSIPELTVDDVETDKVQFKGEWESQQVFMRTYGPTQHMAKAGSEGAAIFTVSPEKSATYRVYTYCPRLRDKEAVYPERVAVRIKTGEKTEELSYSYAENVNAWAALGSFSFEAGQVSQVEFAVPADANLVVDAILLIAE